MLKKALILGIVLGFASLRFAKGTETATGTKTIEPILVFEYKFDEPIVDVIFDEATMTVKEARALGMRGLEGKKATETVRVQHPKVVIVGRKINYTENYEKLEPTLLKFFNEKGKIKKEIFLQEITPKGWNTKVGFSNNKKYIGVLSNIYRYAEDKPYKPSGAKFTMINDEGKILWKVDISKVGYGFPYIFPNGQYILCLGDSTRDYFDYMPSIWDSKGLVKKLFEDEYYEIPYLSFPKDGNWFAVIVETGNLELEKKIFKETGMYGGGRSYYLIAFNEKGNELWRKEGIAKGWDENLDFDFPNCIWSLDISDENIINVITWHVKTGRKFKHSFDKEGNLIESNEVK